VQQGSLSQLFTTAEVARMMNIGRRRLDYWARLGLVQPDNFWGERIYTFGDLVALETIKRLTHRGVPARRLRRAMQTLETQLGQVGKPLSRLRILTNGRQVVVNTPGPGGRPIEPLTGQFVLEFETSRLAGKVRAMVSRTAEEWFEIGLTCDSTPDTLERAVEAYEHALEHAPEWIEAHINLGTVLFQLHRMDEARKHFETAVRLDPANPLGHFNLSCVLEQLGDTSTAVERLRRALTLAPQMADAHLNLALAYERTGRDVLCRKHLALYLQYKPRGPWADYARQRVHPERYPGANSKVTPFRRNA
jgi:DNA-binding transcriptional MerR regulator